MEIYKKGFLFFSFLIFSFIAVGPLRADLLTQNGTIKQRDVQGRLKSILQYKKGHLVRKRFYHDNGKLILDTVYKNGAPIINKTYYISGELKSVWTKKSNQTKYYYLNEKQNL